MIMLCREPWLSLYTIANASTSQAAKLCDSIRLKQSTKELCENITTAKDFTLRRLSFLLLGIVRRYHHHVQQSFAQATTGLWLQYQDREQPFRTDTEQKNAASASSGADIFNYPMEAELTTTLLESDASLSAEESEISQPIQNRYTVDMHPKNRYTVDMLALTDQEEDEDDTVVLFAEHPTKKKRARRGKRKNKKKNKIACELKLCARYILSFLSQNHHERERFEGDVDTTQYVRCSSQEAENLKKMLQSREYVHISHDALPQELGLKLRKILQLYRYIPFEYLRQHHGFHTVKHANKRHKAFIQNQQALAAAEDTKILSSCTAPARRQRKPRFVMDDKIELSSEDLYHDIEEDLSSAPFINMNGRDMLHIWREKALSKLSFESLLSQPLSRQLFGVLGPREAQQFAMRIVPHECIVAPISSSCGRSRKKIQRGYTRISKRDEALLDQYATKAVSLSPLHEALSSTVEDISESTPDTRSESCGSDASFLHPDSTLQCLHNATDGSSRIEFKKVMHCVTRGSKEELKRKTAKTFYNLLVLHNAGQVTLQQRVFNGILTIVVNE